MDKAHVVICAPASWQSLHTTAALELARFFANLEKTNPERLGRYSVVHFDRSNPVDRARNYMIKAGLCQFPQATHFLLLDLDQIYPDGMVDTLLEWDKDIIGPLAFFKSRTPKHHSPIAQVTDDKGCAHPVSVFDGNMNLIDEPVCADILGLGGLLVKREVFEELDYPWFYYDDSTRGITEGLSHDIPFCDAALAAGYELNVLPSLVSPHIAETIVEESYWKMYCTHKQNGSLVDAVQPRPETDSYMNYDKDFFEKQDGHFGNDDLFVNCWDVTREIAERAGLSSGSVIDYGSGNSKFEMAAHGVLTPEQDEDDAWCVTSFDPMPYPQAEFGACGEEALQHQYDVVFCSEVMEHIETEDEAARIVESWHDMNPSLVVCTINMRSHQDVCPTHFLMRTRGWWIEFFESRGWAYDKVLTDVATGKDRHWLEYFIFRPSRLATVTDLTAPDEYSAWDTTEEARI